MTPRIPSGAVPLEVWDTRSARNERAYFFAPGFSERAAWAREHISELDRTYRAEFYLIDLPFAVLYRWAENEQGRRFLDPLTDEPAADEPVLQVLTELPPEHLRIAA